MKIQLNVESKNLSETFGIGVDDPNADLSKIACKAIAVARTGKYGHAYQIIADAEITEKERMFLTAVLGNFQGGNSPTISLMSMMAMAGQL